MDKHTPGRLAAIMRWILKATIASLLMLTIVQAQQEAAFAQEGQQWTVQQKRAWLYENLVGPVEDPQLAQAYTQKLAAMNMAQLDATIASYQQQLLYRQRLLAQQQQLLQNRRGRSGSAGFRPIVTWLPTGTNLTASAIVSPDRRYVRMSLAPFFSSIPRVDTFNYRTGQSRNIYNSTPGYMQPSAAPRTPQLRPGNSWYKKIRTLR